METAAQMQFLLLTFFGKIPITDLILKKWKSHEPRMPIEWPGIHKQDCGTQQNCICLPIPVNK